MQRLGLRQPQYVLVTNRLSPVQLLNSWRTRHCWNPVLRFALFFGFARRRWDFGFTRVRTRATIKAARFGQTACHRRSFSIHDLPIIVGTPFALCSIFGFAHRRWDFFFTIVRTRATITAARFGQTICRRCSFSIHDLPSLLESLFVVYLFFRMRLGFVRRGKRTLVPNVCFVVVAVVTICHVLR